MSTGRAFKNKRTAFDSFFLHQGEEGLAAFEKGMEQVSNKLKEVYSNTEQPFIGKTPAEIEKEIAGIMNFAGKGRSLQEVLNELEGPILRNSLHISHEKSMAHLHCPPLLPGIIGECIIGTLNQSMDSWDQSTAATYVEEGMVKWLKEAAGYPETSDGVFTSGGTQSNYMGLLLARDSFCQIQWAHNVQKQGLPADFHRLRILCSEEAHFTVKKSASQLGLGEQAVITVKTDERHRMCLNDVLSTLDRLKEDGMLPFALVATCGTTDFGSIDPLPELASISKENGLWFHVDAAFGGGLLLSHSHRNKLEGLENADSMTIDFHKLFLQPVSCGAFMVKDRRHFGFLSHHADYLNPVKDEDDGIVNLVTKSTSTTRRFDALKLYLSLKTVGTETFGNMIDHTIELARYTAEYLTGLENIELKNIHPEINTIIFRYHPSDCSTDLDELNRALQQSLLHEGKGVIAKTTVDGSTFLKLTLLNPRTSEIDIHELMDEIEKTATQLMNGGLARV
ncbi:2,4-diaminobutyrate decarboxylase [[Bacillus] enclensis]|uniref:L-2,4-diaminobutyrate decarboxylase n=1 Tax=[Bacillus] enclensis TaxID=1402860 RepID=A0A0V8H8C1_9BACI|nr:aspartate aminotransferase family protein [[Bacillus] enclensis]KSU58724.1 2,4-diaminobutyrate decarboxylase [[Bacillus] enclensis]SCC33605.1 L-2,4-diaminobutyrate decarboxylase [[Bacillus] enclensis]